MKSIVIEVSSVDAQDAALQAALDLVRATSGHLTCVQVQPFAAYANTEPYAGPGMIAALVESIDAQCKDQRERIEAVLHREGVSWDWIRQDGDYVQMMASASRLADALVVAQGPAASGTPRPAGSIAALTLAARAPVIVVPPTIKGFAVAGSALVAWNGSFECAQALRAALPILAMAETVDVVTVGEGDADFPASAACIYLARHGIGAEMLVRGRDGHSTAAAILRAAAERGASYLVAGAYGHSRLREYVFGGVTRALIGDAPLPLVLAH